MASAHNLRVQIEAVLADKVPAALTPVLRGARQYVGSGIDVVDETLAGGLACGVITELVGSVCSGRTSLALAYLSAVIAGGDVCAWVDVADSLCPESAAANGVDLERLLWVRCGSKQAKQSPKPTAGESLRRTETGVPHQPGHTAGGGLHPRSEGRNMPEAISAMLQAPGGVRRKKKSIGTPGAPNRPVAKRPEQREEQVNSDRMPPRRGENLAIAPQCAEPQPRRLANLGFAPPLPRGRDTASEQGKSKTGIAGSPWQGLDQAIRATDLLLQGGGFSVIVLDLGSTPPEIAWRIPLATWFRFRAACERNRVSLLLLTQRPCARSSAELAVRLETGTMQSEGRVMTGIGYRAAAERSRFPQSMGRVIPIRKPPQSERPGQWTSEAAWAKAR